MSNWTRVQVRNVIADVEVVAIAVEEAEQTSRFRPDRPRMIRSRRGAGVHGSCRVCGDA